MLYKIDESSANKSQEKMYKEARTGEESTESANLGENFDPSEIDAGRAMNNAMRSATAKETQQEVAPLTQETQQEVHAIGINI